MPVSKKLLALHPISPGTVQLTSGFWGDRQVQNREVTIPYGMEMMEDSGTLENFRLAAAGGSSAQYHLPLFRDSDLYKVLEAIAWERAHGPDAEQEKFFRSSAELLAASSGARRVPQHLRARRPAGPALPGRSDGPRALLCGPPVPGCGG